MVYRWGNCGCEAIRYNTILFSYSNVRLSAAISLLTPLSPQGTAMVPAMLPAMLLFSAADHFGTLPGKSLKPISAYKVAAPDFNSAASLCVIVEGRSAVS